MRDFISLLVGSFIATTTISIAGNITSWTTGEYENNSNLTKQLNIENAKRLKVTIKGETEQGWDYINIYDKDNNLIRKVSGDIDESFNVIGSSIIANLVSDDSNVDSGVTVSIEDISNESNNDMTEWTTGAYSNNEKSLIKLYSAGADKVKVSIKGKTESGYDFIVIKNSQGKIIKKLSGSINANFVVNGSYITAQLISDDSTTDSGVTVKISPIKKFILYTYAPPSKEYYPDINETWDYYKGANLDTISKIDPNNKVLFKSAENKKHNLKYYLDIRDMVFNINGDEDVSKPGLDINGVDILRGYNEENNETEKENAKPKDIPQSTLEDLNETVSKYKNDPNLKGYWICDEPFPSAYDNLAIVIDEIKQIDPKHPAIVNIGRNEWTTKENLNNFLDKTKVEIFSFNFSIFWRYSEIDGIKYYGGWEGESEKHQVEEFFKRINMIRDLAKSHNSSFMYIAQLVGTEGKDPVEASEERKQGLMWKTPSEDELRWEAYIALTYGAHGLSWFFWEYDGNQADAWGLVDKPDDEQGILYEALQNVNKDISKLKDIMVTLESERVYHNDDRNISKHRPVVAEETNTTVVIGLFEISDKDLYDGYHYFMITNKDYTEELTENYYLMPTKDDYRDIPDNANINLEYFDISTNQWKKIQLHKNKFTSYLAPGEGKLFRFRFSPMIVQ